MTNAGEGRGRQALPLTHASGPHVVPGRRVVMAFRLTLAAVSISRRRHLTGRAWRAA